MSHILNTFRTMKDLLAMDLSVEWIVEGLISREGVTGMFADPKTGKTVATRQLAVAVASGGTFLGRQCARAPVAIINLEGSLAEFKENFVNLRATPSLPIHWVHGTLPIGWEDDKGLALPPDLGLLIVDTFQRAEQIEDVNDYALVVKALDPFIRLAQDRKLALLFVHHTNKGGADAPQSPFARIMGSQGFYGAVDTALVMFREKGGYRRLEVSQRIGGDSPSCWLKFNRDRQTYEIADFQEVMYAQIVEAIKENGPMSGNDIQREVRHKRQSVLDAIRGLEMVGVIKRDKERWTLTGAPLP